MAVHIHPLTPDRIPDLATLFDQGGDPKWCWCAWFRVRGRDWTNATAGENRKLLETAAKEQDHAPGLVAYEDDAVVGWVSLGPREDYERLAFSKALAPLDDKAVWSIVCFVVGRKSRGQGVAAGLLDAAIDYARDHGATTLEAYPVDIARRRADSLGQRVPRHARHVRAGRFQGRRAPQGQPERHPAPDRAQDDPAHDPSMSGAATRPAGPGSDVPTSSVAARPSSSDDVDMAQPERLDFPLARKSHALV